MIVGKKITVPPVITTETPVTPAPGNFVAYGCGKLFEFYIKIYIYRSVCC